jgi:hypothetical protein
MAGCDVLYFDPTLVGQARRDWAGHALGPASDGWRPCTAPGQVWTDPDLVLRMVCAQHRRQLTALHAAGLADQVRWPAAGRDVLFGSSQRLAGASATDHHALARA